MFGAYFDGVVIAAAINGILALGLYIAIATGQFSVGHAGFMAIGAYLSSILTINFGWPLIPAMLAGGRWRSWSAVLSVSRLSASN